MNDEAKRQAVGTRIRRARQAAGLTQDDLARKVGLRGQTVYRYESGALLPGLVALEAIATVCAVTTDWLIRGVGEAPAGEAA